MNSNGEIRYLGPDDMPMEGEIRLPIIPDRFATERTTRPAGVSRKTERAEARKRFGRSIFEETVKAR